MCCGFARDLSRQNRLLSPGRLEDGSCLNLNNCLPAGGVQAPCKTVVGSRNRSQILFAQKKDRSWNFGTGKAGQVDREPTFVRIRGRLVPINLRCVISRKEALGGCRCATYESRRPVFRAVGTCPAFGRGPAWSGSYSYLGCAVPTGQIQRRSGSRNLEP